MHQTSLKAIAWTIGLLFAAVCVAQDTDHPHTEAPASPMPGADAGVAGDQAPPHCPAIAEGTPVLLELLDPVNSATAKRGDRFRLRLVDDIASGDRIIVPAGTEGVGEVVHADASRGGGKPGELSLAARYLQQQAHTIPLRGLKLGGHGKDTIRAATVAAAGIGPFALFIHGKEIEIPAGTQATAKLAQIVSPAATACPANASEPLAAGDHSTAAAPSSESGPVRPTPSSNQQQE
jgi:hypothetical protein